MFGLFKKIDTEIDPYEMDLEDRVRILKRRIADAQMAMGLGKYADGRKEPTLDLHKTHGEDRVFDTPTSENALTGIGVGAAIMGHKVVMTHQRLDFFDCCAT